MASELTVAGTPGDLSPVADRVHDYVKLSKADNTRIAYQKDWRSFTQWCKDHGLGALPATVETIAGYIVHLAETPVYSKTGKQLTERHAVATIERHLASISKAHQTAGYPGVKREGLIKDTMQGIRRSLGVSQDRAAALRLTDLKRIIHDLPSTLQGKRDKALLLVGYAGALRRSELVALTVEDLLFTEQGAIVNIRRSKTNQEGKPESIELGYGTHADTCPVRSLMAWLHDSGIVSGPIFRSINRHSQLQPGALTGTAVSLILKRLALKHGLDPVLFSGHSLRAGCITDLYRQGMREDDIMRQSRHKSRAVMSRYIRESEQFTVNYAAVLGL